MAATTCGVALVAAVAVGCGEVDEDAQPSVPDVDLSAVVVLALDGDVLEVADGPSDLAPASLDPPTVSAGNVIEVVNAGDSPARLRGGDLFDTLDLEPGERTVVVAPDPGGQARSVPLDDGVGPVPTDDAGPHGTLVVVPR